MGGWPVSPTSDQGGRGLIRDRAGWGGRPVGGWLAGYVFDWAVWLAAVGVIVTGCSVHSSHSSIQVVGFLYM